MKVRFESSQTTHNPLGMSMVGANGPKGVLKELFAQNRNPEPKCVGMIHLMHSNILTTKSYFYLLAPEHCEAQRILMTLGGKIIKCGNGPPKVKF